MADWISNYNTYVNMTVAELKELLKSQDLPVSGKKKDLIQYLIFINHPELFLGVQGPNGLQRGKFYDEIPLTRVGDWLEEKWRSNRLVIYATINYQTLKI